MKSENELDELDKFGNFLVNNLRDKGINYAELLMEGHWKAPSLLNIQNELSDLSASQKEAVKKAIISTIDTAIHDFLFALQERVGLDNEIQIIIDGKNVIKLSNGIHGEAYSHEGWYAKYSKYGKVE